MPRLWVALPAAALAVALVGCAQSTPNSAIPAAASTAQASSPAASASAAGAASGVPAKIAVNQTIQDDAFGHTIKILSVVRNFPVPDRLPALKGRTELVLVELSLSAGSKIYGGLMPSEFQLVTENGGDLNPYTPTVNKEIDDAGYKPQLSNNGAGTGKTVTGWAVFKVEPVGNKTLTFRYKRGAATTNTGTVIPAETFDVPLVK
jgi:hypothetical protein